jgi:lipopolysaccharide/colanic/teichoic acid biosynthesis glycosyltransferase
VSKSQRRFDVLGALAGLIVFAPLMMVIAVAVLVSDGPPVFFRQERLGRLRRPFRILNFRTIN